jgi:hypothetical protein
MVGWESKAVHRLARLGLAASGRVPRRSAWRPGRLEHPRSCPPAPGRARPARGRRDQRARAQVRPAPRSVPASLRWVRRRFWLPGQEACPAPRPSGQRPWRRVRLVCSLTPWLPRPRRRRPRGGRRGPPSGARAGAGPWAGVPGGRRGLRVRVAPVVASRRRGVAWAERPWGRAPQRSGRQERGARDGGVGGRRGRPGRAACRAGPAVPALGGFAPVRVSTAPGPSAARRRRAAPAGPRPERVGLLETTSASPRPRAPVWPRPLGPVWPRPTATVCPQLPVRASPRRPAWAWPRLPAPASPRRAGWGEVSGLGWAADEARPVPVASRWVGWANRGAGTGAVGVPRVGWVLARTPGWMPIGCRRGPLGPRARVGDLRGGWRGGGRSTAVQGRDLPRRPLEPAAQDSGRRPSLDGPSWWCRRPVGEAWGSGPEGWHLPGRPWLLSRSRALAADLGATRSALRRRCHAATVRQTGVGALPAGGGRIGSRPGSRRVGLPGGRRACP